MSEISSFRTHYARRVVGRGRNPVVHVKQVEAAQSPPKHVLCGVEAGPYVGGASVPNCRKCIAKLRQIERTGEEGKDSARPAVAAAELLARTYTTGGSIR